MSGRISSRSGNDLNTPAIFFASTSTQSGSPTWPAISIAFWMRKLLAGLLTNTYIESPALIWADGMLTILPFTSMLLWLTS